MQPYIDIDQIDEIDNNDDMFNVPNNWLLTK